MDAVEHLHPFNGDFLPSFYNYGSAYLLLCRVVIDVLAGYHLAEPFMPRGGMPVWIHDFARLFLIGRLVAVALALGTVALTYAAARRLYGRRAGCLAALFLAVAPMHVVMAHYMVVDVPAAFFTMLCVYLAATALPGGAGVRRSAFGRRNLDPNARCRTPNAWSWLAIGAAAGLAAGTKYNAGIVLLAGLAPLTALALRVRGPADGFLVPTPNAERRTPTAALRLWLGGGLIMLAGAALSFLASTPGAIFDTPRFLADFLFEVHHSQRGHGQLFWYLPPAAIYHAIVSLPIGLGWPLWSLSLGGVALAVRNRRPADWLLLLAVVPYYLVLADSNLRFLRYVVPLLPPLSILAARCVVSAAAVCARRRAQSAERRARSAGGREPAGSGRTDQSEQSDRSDRGGAGPRQPLRPWRFGLCALPFAAAAVAALVALASSIAHVGVMAGEDPREAAARCLLDTTPDGALVALAADPFFYTPPIDPTAGCVKRAARYGGPPVWDLPDRDKVLSPFPLGRFRFLVPEGWPHPAGALPLVDLRKWRPLRVVISDYEYADPLRVRAHDPRHAARDATVRLWDALQAGYVLEREFRVRPSLFGFEWFANSTPPHDWAYYMPTIQVYRRRE
jgi:hypothetical protein